jgi:Rrf2 family protein
MSLRKQAIRSGSMDSKLQMERCNSSMQLTRAADYAVRVMVFLAGNPAGERASLAQIVKATDAPDSFLSKVLQGLTRAGFITSRRGPAGGFEISAIGRLTSMREVVEAIDGPISLNVCLSQRRPCPRRRWCAAHPVWARAQEALLGVLSRAMIADMASGKVEWTALAHIRTGTDA